MAGSWGPEAGAQAPASFSLPPYPTRHTGTALVCGFAPSLWGDLERARELRPDAKIIAVNRAATAIEAFAVFSLHHGKDKLGIWAQAQREKFNAQAEVHAHGSLDNLEKKRGCYPYVDYWWPDARGTGTSSWAAAKLAALMGFEERILCGVLIERAPYADATFCRDFRRQPVLKLYRDYIKNDTDWHRGVSAMSGWPRKFFGPPGPRP